MKNIFILSFLFFVGIRSLSAQAYHKFLVDSAHWTITEWQCNGLCDAGNPPSASDCFTYSTFYFKLDGDTSVNGRIYKKLLQKLVSSELSGTNQSCVAASYNGSYTCAVVGLLWEDSSARKVFIMKTGSPTSACWQSQDSLLFDFSKQIGDSISFQASCFNRVASPPIYLVSFIDSGGYNQHRTKTWHLQAENPAVTNVYLYESIGASTGFWGYDHAGEGTYGTRLTSYCIGSDSICGFTCDISSGINAPSVQSISISVFPNPAKDILSVEVLNTAADEKMSFKITDILGREIYSRSFTESETKLDMSGFKSGIYLWQLLSDQRIIQSGKFTHLSEN